MTLGVGVLLACGVAQPGVAAAGPASEGTGEGWPVLRWRAPAG
jgi:hypothetical protein